MCLSFLCVLTSVFPTCDLHTLHLFCTGVTAKLRIATCHISSSLNPSSALLHPSRPSISVPLPALCVSAAACRRRCPHPVCASGSHNRADVRLDVSGLSRSTGTVRDTEPDRTGMWRIELSLHLCLALAAHFGESICTLYGNTKGGTSETESWQSHRWLDGLSWQKVIWNLQMSPATGRIRITKN